MVTTCTYRIQFNYQFQFKDIIKILPYLKILGVSHIYCSPITQARSKSMHGYDVINPNQINSDLGGIKEFNRFVAAAKQLKLNVIIDIVPNHMAATSENQWWEEVKSQKIHAPHAKYFDINWKVSDETLSYRRFFDINELVCMNVQDDEVFNATHQLVLDLVNQNKIQGIRIDHIDGLRFPKAYLEKLKNHLKKSVLIEVEKILAKNETLSKDWKIEGTTGYDFLNQVNQLYIDRIGFKQLTIFYQKFTRNKKTIEELRFEKNCYVIKSLFKNELNTLVKKLQSILNILKQFYADKILAHHLILISATIPVYRTYIDSKINRKDMMIFEHMQKIIRSSPFITKKIQDKKLVKLIFSLMKLEYPTIKHLMLDWLCDWQVFTSPMIAKGFEDTTSYIYNVLISLNEVGSSPEYFVSVNSLSEFHQFMKERQQKFPETLNASSTHDTKRSEDVRARINVISEMPIEWKKRVSLWHKLNAKYKTKINNKWVPDNNVEILLYQTLIGAWPLFENGISVFKENLFEFITKALREQKQYTNWQNPNLNYEVAVKKFIIAILSTDHHFLSAFIPFQKKIAFYGGLNSLSQTLLKLTSPGIPDIYQGNESWQFDLVDPGNRHLVNFKQLTYSLHELLSLKLDYSLLSNNWQNGQIKQLMIYQILKIRKKYQNLFLKGNYLPLQVIGKKAKYIIAYARKYQNQILIVVTARYFYSLDEENNGWQNTAIMLPVAGQYKSCLMNETYHLEGKRILIKHLLNNLPMNVLLKLK